MSHSKSAQPIFPMTESGTEGYATAQATEISGIFEIKKDDYTLIPLHDTGYLESTLKG